MTIYFHGEHDWRIFLPEYSREILKTSNRRGLEIFCKISSDEWLQGFWKTLGMNFDSPLWCSQSSSIFYWRNAPEYFINIWKSSYYSSCFPLNRMAIEILFFKSLEYRQVIRFNMISSDLGFSSRWIQIPKVSEGVGNLYVT